MTSVIMSIFLKNVKMAKMFFSKINLATARKKDFQDVFSAFESHDNIKIEYI